MNNLLTFSKKIDVIEKIIGYNFDNKELLIEAFTHPSYNQKKNYEKMEFLGDSLINSFTTLWLYHKKTQHNVGELSIEKSQIINNESIYYLPVVMYILEEAERTLAESFWFNQLKRDGFLSEFTTENHELTILIFTDKHGTVPWDSTCESYWPDICPAPILAAAQHKIIGDDTLYKKLQKNIDRL